MNPKKIEVRKTRLYQNRLPTEYRFKNFPKITKKRYLQLQGVLNAGNEWILRTNYLKLNKGFHKNGESKLISLLKKREFKLTEIKNSHLVKRYKNKHIDRLVNSVKDS